MLSNRIIPCLDVDRGRVVKGVHFAQLRDAAPAMSGDQFRCVITNASGSVTAAPATLTVSSAGVSTLAGWPGWSGYADGQGAIHFKIHAAGGGQREAVALVLASVFGMQHGVVWFRPGFEIHALSFGRE